MAEELEALERELLGAEARRDAGRLRELLAVEFREFGSSGRVFDREAIVAELLGEEWVEVRADGFLCELLGDGVALLTYRSERAGGRAAWRSSLWVWRDDRWQMVFHQGTRVADPS